MKNPNDAAVNHAVQYDNFGDTDVLYIAQLEKPVPQKGEVLVKVKAAGINPGEASIRTGRLQKQFPSTFPSGQGSDFAGVVEDIGDDVTSFNSGDEVIGFSNNRNSQAEYVVVKADQLVSRPPKVSWEQAGGLFVVGSTAYAAVHAVNIKKGDLLIVSAAAGGVGSVAVQIAKNMGADVIGIAGRSNHEWLKEHGIIPVDYDGDVEENIRAVLKNRRPNAFIDAAGKTYVELAINLGVPLNRIDTIIDFVAASKYKVKTEGSAAASSAKVLNELAEMIENGDLEIPIAKTYPLEQVKEAYEELEQHHTHGKIILVP